MFRFVSLITGLTVGTAALLSLRRTKIQKALLIPIKIKERRS